MASTDNSSTTPTASSGTGTVTGTVSGELTGCVKWFDNGLNYGFITVLTDGDHKNADIFVHQSNIRTGRDCFRTLYTGECVQFDLAKSNNEKHPFHAVNVHGFNGTLLHCENPNYRPRRVGGARGRGTGRGAGRGRVGGRNGGHRNQSHQNEGTNQENQPTQSPQETAEVLVNDVSTSGSTSAPPSTETSADASAAVTTGAKPGGRGRGRGRKVSA